MTGISSEDIAIKLNNDNRAAWRSRLHELFPKLAAPADPAARRLLEQAQFVTLEQNRFVFRSGDLCNSFLLLIDGNIRVQLISAEGREVTLYRIGSGGSCILTTSCLLGREHYPAEAVTETDIVALAITNVDFQEALDKSRQFRDFVFDGFSTRLTGVIRRIEQLALTSIDYRLAATLLELQASGATEVTHQQLATELGTAREVVSRHLKALERAGIVQLGRSQVTVLDRPRLQRMIESASL